MEQETTQETITTQTIDYEAEYKKVLAERDNALAEVKKQKELKDKYAEENGKYRRKAEAQMTEEEKKQKEWQEMLAQNEKMSKEIAQMKLEKDLLANGFSPEECTKLIDGNFAVKDIADIIKDRVDKAVKSSQAEFTKDSTPKSLMGKGTADTQNSKSNFQLFQESNKKSNDIVEL